MKTIIVHETTDLGALARRLGGEDTLETLKRLNPQVRPERVPAGTTLLVPGAGTHEGAQSPGAPQVRALAAELKSALHTAVGASSKGLDLRAKERKQVADVLRVPAMKRVLDADPDLKTRAAAIAENHRREQAGDRATDKALKQLQTEALAAIEELLRALG